MLQPPASVSPSRPPAVTTPPTPRRATSSQPAMTCKPGPCPLLLQAWPAASEHSTSARRPGNKRWLENLKTKTQETISSQEIFLTFSFSKKGRLYHRGSSLNWGQVGRRPSVSHTPPSGQPSSRQLDCLPAHLLVLFTRVPSLQRKLSLTLHASPCPQHPLPCRVLRSGGIQNPRGKDFSSDGSGSHCSK